MVYGAKGKGSLKGRQNGGQGRAQGEKKFTAADITKDDDWKNMKPILARYFTSREITPERLVTKKRNHFSKLMELFLNDTIDFKAYCKWYYDEKYPDKGFNYGLFLYSDMIKEYKEINERKGPNGAIDWNSEKNKRDLQETMDFIDSLEE